VRVCLPLSLAACAGSDPQSTESLPTSDASGAVIINHLNTQLDRVPVEWIARARQTLRIAYGHTSHGSQLVTGRRGLSRVRGLDLLLQQRQRLPHGRLLTDAFPTGTSEPTATSAGATARLRS